MLKSRMTENTTQCSGVCGGRCVHIFYMNKKRSPLLHYGTNPSWCRYLNYPNSNVGADNLGTQLLTNDSTTASSEHRAGSPFGINKNDRITTPSPPPPPPLPCVLVFCLSFLKLDDSVTICHNVSVTICASRSPRWLFGCSNVGLNLGEVTPSGICPHTMLNSAVVESDHVLGTQNSTLLHRHGRRGERKGPHCSAFPRHEKKGNHGGRHSTTKQKHLKPVLTLLPRDPD